MTTIKINEKTKKGKAFLAMTRAFFEDFKEIEIVEEENYNMAFVEKILKSREEKGQVMETVDNLWESL